MTILKRLAMILPLLLAACATAPQQHAEPAAKQEAGALKPEEVAKPEKPLVLPNVEMSDEMLYEFLLGEVALQRGMPDLATQTYLDLAQETRDPRVARRAAQMAFESHELDKAVDAFKLWIELEPDSQLAKRMLTTLLVSGGRLDEARPYLVEMLAAEPDNVGHTFMQLFPLLARYPQKSATADLLIELTHPYPQVPEAHWVLAQAAEAAGRHDLALAEAKQVRTLRPQWDMGVLLEAQLLKRDAPKQSLAVLEKYLSSNPDAKEVRLFYARTLLDQKQYKQARVEFQHLLTAYPNNADLAFAVALLSLQMGELDQAAKELQQALDNGKKDQNTVYYYLGQLSEAKKDYDLALQQYRKVQGGEYAYPASMRIVYLLSKQGKVDEAREQLHRTAVQDKQQHVQMVLIEAQILRDAQRDGDAYQVLLQGLEKLPNHPDLLYEAALLADKLGKPEVLERFMRKLIQLQPDNANAYNALGYSLLERNVRLPEGMQLVEKAYQLAPNDAAIIDSVGWGHYRLGDLAKSVEFLRRAYSANPDPEIAAHLGEVLWVKGEKDEAKKIWSGSLKDYPNNAALLAVMKKFMP